MVYKNYPNDFLVRLLEMSIKKHIEFKGLLIVLVDDDITMPYGDDTHDQNIIAFNDSGLQKWVISPSPVGESPKPYTNLEVVDGKLIVGNWCGVNYYVNIENGSITPAIKDKNPERPW